MEEFYQMYPQYELDTGNKTEEGEALRLIIQPCTQIEDNQIVVTHEIVYADDGIESTTAFALPVVIGEKIIWDIDLFTGDTITADNYFGILPTIQAYLQKNYPESLLYI